MTKHNIFRLLPAGVVLCLLALAVLPSTMLAADRAIRVVPGEAAEDGSVNVQGEGFAQGYPSVALRAGFVFVTLYLSPELANPGDRIGVDVVTYAKVTPSARVDEFGRWKTAFPVPDCLADGINDGIGVDVKEGAYYVYVTFWNDDVIQEMGTVQVKEVVPDWFPFERGYRGFPPSWYRPYDYSDDCSCRDDGWTWVRCGDHILWVPPDDWCGEWPDGWSGGWSGGWYRVAPPWLTCEEQD